VNGPLWQRKAVDADFYETHLRRRLPAQIVDAHVHLNLPEHVANVPRERLLSDWALEVAHQQSYEDARFAYAALLPGINVRLTGFPWPIKEADLAANNAWLAGLRAQGKLAPMMATRPQWPAEHVERILVEGRFAGLKPYGDMVSGVKGADISIFDFLPHEHLAVADRHRKAITLHLPRRGRLADDQNIRELKDIRQAFPNVRLIIAHLGRSYNPCYISQGLDKLGDASWFFFDIAAVLNPEVYRIAFDRLCPRQILFGTDLPIMLLRGRREWTEASYINLSSGDYTWNKHHRPPQEEQAYTFFLYELLRAMLDAMDAAAMGAAQRALVFSGNAERVFEMA